MIERTDITTYTRKKEQQQVQCYQDVMTSYGYGQRQVFLRRVLSTRNWLISRRLRDKHVHNYIW